MLATKPVSPLRPRRVLYSTGSDGTKRLLLADVAGGSFEHPSLVNIRPLTIEFFREIATFLADHYEGCQCKLVGAFNRALGCNKAAMMHLEEGTKYGEKDWFDHFHEEDVIEIPLMISLSELDHVLDEYVTKISADHEMFRRTPFEDWQPQWLAQHADLEDQAMVRVIRVMQGLIT